MRQNQPIRSSEVCSRRAHETRIVFVSVGFDATRKGVMKLRKLSKVVFHRPLPPRQLPKVGWRKSYQTVCGVLLQLLEELERMKKDALFH